MLYIACDSSNQNKMTIDLVKAALIDDIKRRLVSESAERIYQCLNTLSEEDIWSRPNDSSNSVGNLVLHLSGNLRQYICSGVGGQNDIRKRSMEFSSRSSHNRQELIELFRHTMTDVVKVIDTIESKDLTESKSVQGFEENVISILIHVTEHLSYHVGQIAYYTKMVKDEDLGFYEGLDLDVTN